MKKLLLLVGLTISTVSMPTLSHPGRTASDGCHYCRTNCSAWGVPEGARHCHVHAEPTNKDLESSEVVKRHSDEDGQFVTIKHNDVWTTFISTSAKTEDKS